MSSTHVEKTQIAHTNAQHSSCILVFFGSKGGCGSTSLAVNVAHALAIKKKSVTLVDIDFHLGDVMTALSLTSKFTLAAASSTLKKGQGFNLESLPTHKSGLRVLSQAGLIDHMETLNAEEIGRLLDYLQTQCDYVIVDGVHDFSEHILTLLDRCKHLVLTTIQEVLAIRRTRLIVKILRKIGIGDERIFIVVNQCSANATISLSALEKMFAPIVVCSLIKDEALMINALNRGVALLDLNSKHKLTQQIGDLTQKIIEGRYSSKTHTHVDDLNKKTFWQRLTSRQ